MRLNIYFCLLAQLFAFCTISFSGKFNDLMGPLNKIIDPSHRTQFCEYYKKLMNKQRQISVAQRTKNLRNLQSLGRASLHVKNEQWIHGVLQQAQTWPRAKQDCFFVRCGAYEQFVREQVLERSTLWHQVRAYAWNAKNKVISWVEAITHRKRV